MTEWRNLPPYEHEEDEFDRDEYIRLPWESRPRDWLDDQDDGDLEKWLGDRS